MSPSEPRPVGPTDDDPSDCVVARGPIRVTAVDSRGDGGRAVALEALAGLLAAVLEADGVDWPAEASITLVDPTDIAELNLEHLGKDGPTDVLSFPLDGRDAEGATTAMPAMVGDIVLCPEVAAANAPTHAGTVDDEFALLVVHGGLHLLDWDHATPEEQAAMWARERELLPALYRPPARDPWSDHPEDAR